jgi:hypothetical protein
MQWILVVLVGGVAPVPTDLVFENLSDCSVADEQLRKRGHPSQASEEKRIRPADRRTSRRAS